MHGEATYTQDGLRALLPWPERDAHKYSRGKLVVVAGCARFPGAAVLAAVAGQRMGAGYVEVLCAPESVAVVQAARPSLVASSWERVANDDFAGFPASSVAKPAAYVVGPGFDGSNPECLSIALAVLENACAPVLVDGGALDTLASEEGRRVLTRRAERGLVTVVTPHGGEAARLARPLGISLNGMSAPEISARLAAEYGVVCVLKGVDTYISNGAEVVPMMDGTAALAKAGTGDVLAGMVGALLAQGVGAMDAAVLGATLHARAGVAAAERYTAISATAEDVIECLPEVIRLL